MSFRSVFKKAVDTLSLFLMGVLAPTVVAAFVSADALPGDKTYPLKLSVENMAVFVSQVYPKAEMELRLAILDRRYREARILLKDQGSARGYKYFVESASAAQRAVLGIRNDDLRDRYNEELAGDLKRYQSELEVLIGRLETP